MGHKSRGIIFREYREALSRRANWLSLKKANETINGFEGRELRALLYVIDLLEEEYMAFLRHKATE